MDEVTYTVGALAKSSGLTVRTLHHWDAIGLLVPAERAGNGYRRYGAGEVARLYRILDAGLQEYVGRAMEARGA